jgi:hypothetical protein
MKHSAEMHRCLRDCDVAAIRKLWRRVAPDMPQPADDREALRDIHYARTTMSSMPTKLREYSHSWLINNCYPSGLPDKMRPKAERIYPVIKSAVGIAMKATSKDFKAAIPVIRGAMEQAVMDAYEQGRLEDGPFVRERIKEAREYTTRKLFGVSKRSETDT